MHGGDGDDVITLGAGSEDGWAYGENGNDEIIDLGADNSSFGGEGDDRITLAGVTSLFSAGLADGGAGDDTLIDTQWKATLLGGLGDDTLIGASGSTLVGGAGADHLEQAATTSVSLSTASYIGSPDGVTVDLGAATAAGGDAEGDTLVGIANLTGSDHGDTLTGSTTDNVIEGGDGDDVIDGVDGQQPDYAHGNKLYGGAGDDVILSGAGGALSYGGDGDDTITNEGRNGELYGDAGNDTLVNESGEARIVGGDGDDIMVNLGGDALFYGGAGADVMDDRGTGTSTAEYWDSDAGVEIDLAAGTAAGGHAEGDTLSGIDNLYGSSFADTLTGDAVDNLLFGAWGADQMDGGDGDDRLVVSTADTVTGGGGADLFEAQIYLDQPDYLDYPGHDVDGAPNALAVQITDFDPALDELVIEYGSEHLHFHSDAEKIVDVVDWSDGTGADVYLGDHLVAQVTGGAGISVTAHVI